MNALRHLTVAVVALVPLATPALADPQAAGPVTHTDQLVVVTPNAPVVITNGGAPGAAPSAAIDPEMPARAPQTEPWNEVSHINGTPVKVGERGDYLLRYRKTNIASNPIGWMFGFYGVSVSHAIHPNVAVRADANLFSFEREHGYELGISAPIYFRRVYSGPFIEPGLVTRELRSETDIYPGCIDCVNSNSGPMTTTTTTSTLVGPEILFGWHWSFDSGLNVAMAFGAARQLSGSGSHDEPQPVGYFRIGYAL